MVDDLGVMVFVYKWQVRQQMIKPGDGGYNIGGDCEKGSGRLLTAWAFYPVSGISGRVSGSGDVDYNDSLELRRGAACRRVYVKSGKTAG
ncbi:hypothetical protein FWZ15_02280 [Escherichia coli]|nr:hypothetical protein [Escherichia coli]